MISTERPQADFVFLKSLVLFFEENSQAFGSFASAYAVRLL